VNRDGDRVETFKGCGALLLLYLLGSVVTGVILGLTVAVMAWLFGWL
jgi:hypothetical protein